MNAWRIAFVAAFGFYVAVERERDPSLLGRPIAVVRGGKVVDVSPEVRAKGIAPGLKRANLLELCPEACLLPYQAERYDQGQRRLLDLFARHVPAVEPVETTQTFLDVAGLAPAVCQRIGREVWAEFKVAVGFGLGPTKVLARAAGLELARKAAGRAGATPAAPPDPGAIMGVPAGSGPGGQTAQAFLDSLPVSYLYPLPEEVPARLERLGFRSIGEVRGLPFVELVRQFGRPLARRIATAAAGGEADPVRRTWPPPSLQAVRRFEGGLDDRESLGRALGEVAEVFARVMADKALACGEITLSFAGEEGRREEVTRRLAKPGRSRATLAYALTDLAERLLGSWSPGDPPVELEARASRVLPLAAEQLDLGYLFGPPALPASPPALPARATRSCSSLAAATPTSADEAREVSRQLAWRFGDKVIRGLDESGAGARRPVDDLSSDANRRARRETLLTFYDPLRAGGRARV